MNVLQLLVIFLLNDLMTSFALYPAHNPRLDPHHPCAVLVNSGFISLHVLTCYDCDDEYS